MSTTLRVEGTARARAQRQGRASSVCKTSSSPVLETRADVKKGEERLNCRLVGKAFRWRDGFRCLRWAAGRHPFQAAKQESNLVRLSSSQQPSRAGLQ